MIWKSPVFVEALWHAILTYNLEAKLRFANTSEENAKKISKQAKHSELTKGLKDTLRNFFPRLGSNTFSHLLHGRL